MQVNGLKSVAQGGSSTPGKVAGLGREAMLMNFITMVDEWLDLMKQYQKGGAKASTHSSTNNAAAMSTASMCLSPFYTCKQNPSGSYSIQKVGSPDVATTLHVMA
jgi:hypothetical protein